MIIAWIGKLLRRPARSGEAPLPRPERRTGPDRRRGSQLAGGAGSRRDDRADVLDLRRIAVYATSDREPLHPRDGERLGGLQAEVRTWLRERTRAAVPLPELAQRLIQRGVASGQKDINGLVQLLHQDPVLTAQILRAANAAEHAGLGPVRGIREAVMRLGTEAAWQLALAVAVHTVLDREATALHQRFRQAWQEQWSHATAAAAAAGWLAMTYPRATWSAASSPRSCTTSGRSSPCTR